MGHNAPTTSNVQPIDATVRDRVGSTYSKRLREAGRLPAVIYGRDGDCVSIHMDENEAMKHLNRGFRSSPFFRRERAKM